MSPPDAPAVPPAPRGIGRAYDFIVASKEEPEAWRRAIGTVGSEERQQIADHVESLPEKWIAEGRRVLNPAYPEVVTNLRSRSRILLLKTENSG